LSETLKAFVVLFITVFSDVTVPEIGSYIATRMYHNHGDSRDDI